MQWNSHKVISLLSLISPLCLLENIFLMRMAGLTWGSLSTHLSKIESAGYLNIGKSFKGKKHQTIIYLTEQGRKTFREYKKNMKQVLNDLPD